MGEITILFKQVGCIRLTHSDHVNQCTGSVPGVPGWCDRQSWNLQHKRIPSGICCYAVSELILASDFLTKDHIHITSMVCIAGLLTLLHEYKVLKCKSQATQITIDGTLWILTYKRISICPHPAPGWGLALPAGLCFIALYFTAHPQPDELLTFSHKVDLFWSHDDAAITDAIDYMARSQQLCSLCTVCPDQSST